MLNRETYRVIICDGPPMGGIRGKNDLVQSVRYRKCRNYTSNGLAEILQQLMVMSPIEYLIL